MHVEGPGEALPGVPPVLVMSGEGVAQLGLALGEEVHREVVRVLEQVVRPESRPTPSARIGGSIESIRNAVAVKPSTSGASGVMAEGLRRAVTTVTVAAQVRATERKASLSTTTASNRPRGA